MPSTKKKSIPEFRSEDHEREFWAAHDSTEFVDWESARRRKLPIIVINRGATKGAGRAVLKLEAGTSETLAGLADRLCP